MQFYSYKVKLQLQVKLSVSVLNYFLSIMSLFRPDAIDVTLYS